MLKSSVTVEVQAARSAVSVNGFTVTKIEVDVLRKRIAIQGSLMSGVDQVRVKNVELSVGDAALATLVGQVETGLKKKFADKIGFDDTKTTVE